MTAEQEGTMRKAQESSGAKRAIAAPILSVLSLFLVIGLLAMPASAQTIDPQIYVCTGCTAPPGGDPNLIDPNSINVGFAGNHTAVSPLLIIVGVPAGGSDPTLSLPSGVNPAAAGTYYGLNAATSGGLSGVSEGTLTMSSNDAYTTSGLTAGSGGGASESFVNWTTTPYPGGGANPDVGVTSFSLYGYAIDYALNSGNGGNSPITIDFSNIALGSYVIAYNCMVSGSTCTDGDIGATPFTNAGAVVPEASSLILFGFGLLAIGFVMRRRLLVSDDSDGGLAA